MDLLSLSSLNFPPTPQGVLNVEQYLEQCSGCAWVDGHTIKLSLLTSVPLLGVQTQIFISSGSVKKAEAKRVGCVLCESPFSGATN